MIDWRKLSQLTPADIAEALEVPVQAVQLVWDVMGPVERLRAIRAQYVAQVWDGTSPLNTWTPDQIREVFNPPRYGQIVYVHRADDGKILDLQPTVPGTNDPIVKTIAQDVADAIADQRALNDAVPALYAEALDILQRRAVELVQQHNPDASLEDVTDYVKSLLGEKAGEDFPDGTRI